MFEDQQIQKILEFFREDRPITMAILLDSSGSMVDKIKEVHQAAGSFVETLREEDRALIIDSNDVGATGVFDASLDGQKLTFSLKNDRFVDDQTGTSWNILGEALEGEMAGKSLTPIVHGNHFWFAWGAFNPDTLIYKGQG